MQDQCNKLAEKLQLQAQKLQDEFEKQKSLTLQMEQQMKEKDDQLQQQAMKEQLLRQNFKQLQQGLLSKQAQPSTDVQHLKHRDQGQFIGQSEPAIHQEKEGHNTSQPEATLLHKELEKSMQQQSQSAGQQQSQGKIPDWREQTEKQNESLPQDQQLANSRRSKHKVRSTMLLGCFAVRWTMTSY
jgi:hypothetical protein